MIATWLSSPEIAGWIVGMLLKGTAILLLVWAITTALGRASASLRHLLWAIGLTGVVAVPLLNLALPWRLAVPQLVTPSVSSEERKQTEAVSADQAKAQTVEPVSGFPQPSSAQTGHLPQVADSFPIPLSASTITTGLLVVWLLGLLFVLVRLALGAAVLRRIVREGNALEGPEWHRPLVESADRLSLEHLPRLYMSERLPMPFACGVLRPVVVLPVAAREWTEQRRRAVLCHELAHLRRFDLVLNALGQIAGALYWFHPLVRMALRKLRAEGERACDDLVLGVGTRPSEYADHLLQIVRQAGRSRTPSIAVPMAQRGEFEGRMLAILEPGARRDPTTRLRSAVVAVLASVLVVPLSALGPATATAPPPSKAGLSVQVTGSIRNPAPRPQPRPMTTPTPRVAPRNQAAISSEPAPRVVPGDSLQPRAIAALIRTLDDSVPAVRLDAAYALGRLRATEGVKALSARLEREPASDVREMLAWSLGQIGSSASTPALIHALQRDSSASVRAMVIWAMGQIRDPESVAALDAALTDTQSEVAGRAAWAIGTIRPDQAPPRLIAALRSNSTNLQVRAAWAIGTIADSAAANALGALLQSPDKEVRHAALWALGRLGGTNAQSALLRALENSDSEVRAQAARSLGGGSGDPWPWPWPMPMVR